MTLAIAEEEMTAGAEKRKALFNKLDTYALVGVVVGAVLMGQPFSKFVFTLGFPVVFVATVLHMVFDHLR